MHKQILLAITLVTYAHNSSAMNTADVPPLKELALKAALLNDEARDTLFDEDIVTLSDVRADAKVFLDKHVALKAFLSKHDRERATPYLNTNPIICLIYVYDATSNIFKKQGNMSSLTSAQLQTMEQGNEWTTDRDPIWTPSKTLLRALVFGRDQKLQAKYCDAIMLYQHNMLKRKKYAHLFPTCDMTKDFVEAHSTLQVPSKQNNQGSYKQWPRQKLSDSSYYQIGYDDNWRCP